MSPATLGQGTRPADRATGTPLARCRRAEGRNGHFTAGRRFHRSAGSAGRGPHDVVLAAADGRNPSSRSGGVICRAMPPPVRPATDPADRTRARPAKPRRNSATTPGSGLLVPRGIEHPDRGRRESDQHGYQHQSGDELHGSHIPSPSASWRSRDPVRGRGAAALERRGARAATRAAIAHRPAAGPRCEPRRRPTAGRAYPQGRLVPAWLVTGRCGATATATAGGGSSGGRRRRGGVIGMARTHLPGGFTQCHRSPRTTLA